MISPEGEVPEEAGAKDGTEGSLIKERGAE